MIENRFAARLSGIEIGGLGEFRGICMVEFDGESAHNLCIRGRWQALAVMRFHLDLWETMKKVVKCMFSLTKQVPKVHHLTYSTPIISLCDKIPSIYLCSSSCPRKLEYSTPKSVFVGEVRRCNALANVFSKVFVGPAREVFMRDGVDFLLCWTPNVWDFVTFVVPVRVLVEVAFVIP